MLDRRSRVAYFIGLVLPHLDYADMVWGDQQGLKSEMDQLQSSQNRFAKKILGGDQSSADARKSLYSLALAARRFCHRCVMIQNSLTGNIPEHFECFRINLRQSHGYNTRNGFSFYK